jgi:hypothetical protein
MEFLCSICAIPICATFSGTQTWRKMRTICICVYHMYVGLSVPFSECVYVIVYVCVCVTIPPVFIFITAVFEIGVYAWEIIPTID